jgi:hypothetical protein
MVVVLDGVGVLVGVFVVVGVLVLVGTGGVGVRDLVRVGVELVVGVGQSTMKAHAVLVNGANTINFAWSGNADGLLNEPLP